MSYIGMFQLSVSKKTYLVTYTEELTRTSDVFSENLNWDEWFSHATHDIDDTVGSRHEMTFFFFGFFFFPFFGIQWQLEKKNRKKKRSLQSK